MGSGSRGGPVISDQGAEKGLTEVKICLSRRRSGEGHSGKRERQVQRLERRVNLTGLGNSKEASRTGAANRREKATRWER